MRAWVLVVVGRAGVVVVLVVRASDVRRRILEGTW